jgi:hypothetical protein
MCWVQSPIPKKEREREKIGDRRIWEIPNFWM